MRNGRASRDPRPSTFSSGKFGAPFVWEDEEPTTGLRRIDRWAQKHWLLIDCALMAVMAGIGILIIRWLVTPSSLP